MKQAQVQQASLSLSQEKDCFIQLKITDAGVGFDSALSNSDRQKEGGFGLFSVRERVRALGGQMDIHSQPGKGTSITLLVPQTDFTSSAIRFNSDMSETEIDESNAPSLFPNEPSSLLKKVLLVEDHAIVREGLACILEEQPAIRIVAQAINGLEAVEKARAYIPDVVIMDINMPVMNGIEAMRIIKQERPETQVIVLSCHEEEGIGDRLREIGASAYLSKGGDPRLLVEAVLKGSDEIRQ